MRRRRRLRRRGRDGRRPRRLPARRRSATPRSRSPTTAPRPTIELTQNPDILAELAHDRPAPGPVVVGFAAETGDDTGSVLDLARAKLARKGCDLLVVNDVSGGAVFGSAGQRGRRSSPPTATAVDVPRGSKTALAHVDLGPGRRPAARRPDAA